ncbi:MAG: hypothetical protein ACKN9V_10935 [Pseudomonadota bacterium]
MFHILFTFFVLASVSFAQECSHLWQTDLKTGTIGPKGYLGDTHAAYGIMAFLNQQNRYYVIKGQFPQARFFSVETYNGRKNGAGSSLVDSKMVPDPGSLNPFTDGTPIDTPHRNYTIIIAPEGTPQKGANQIPFRRNERFVSFYIRYYFPNKGLPVSLSDLPRVEAYDLDTGEPASCSKSWTVENFTPYPQFLGLLSQDPPGVFSFQQAQWNKGANSAVGKYAEGHSQMSFDEVALIRFKAPTYVNTFTAQGLFNSDAQVRYWSLCATNFPNNQGLACLADQFTTPDEKGYVTVVNGSGEEIQKEALKRGYYFIPDMRPPNSQMVLFPFRNILPSKTFKENQQYQGDFNPKIRICHKDDFLEGTCEWWK